MEKKRKHYVQNEIHKTKRFKEDFEQLMGGKRFKRNWNASKKFPGSKSNKLVSKLNERKRKRQEERKLKKARRLAYSQHKPMPNPDVEKEKEKKKLEEERKNNKLQKRKKRNARRKKALQKKKQREIEEEKEEKEKVEDIRRRNLEKGIREEEMMLKQLEKQLHLNKRKRKGLPQSFLSDGLDYILDVVDENKISGILADTQDSDLDQYSDNEDLGVADAKWLKSKKRKLDASEDTGSSEDEDDSEETDDEEEDDGNDEEESDDDASYGNEEEDEERKQKLIDKIMSKILPRKGENIKHKPTTTESDSPTDKCESTPAVSILKKSKGNNTVKGEKSKHVSFTNVHDYNSNDDDDDDDNDDDDGMKDLDSDDDDKGMKDFGSDYDDDDDDDDDEGMKDLGSGDDDENSGDSEEEVADKKEKLVKRSGNTKDLKETLKEDIYGRLRDKSGNIVKDASLQGSYIPPGKRLAMAAASDSKNSMQLERLKKQLKGLVNRASAANMNAISSQIEDLYLTHSRGDMNEILSSLIMDACVSVVMTPERLAMELVMLLTILNSNVGTEVGATFSQSLAERYNGLCTGGGYGQGKEMDNVVVLFCYLYNFKVIHSLLISDLIRRFVESFGEKDIELILLILKNVGFTLRKDDPAGLKDLIQEVQKKASSTDTNSFTEKSRVQFMLDTLMAIKNNNMRKIPNYDPELFEDLKKQTRVHIKGSSLGADQLRISLSDLIEARNKGRWWVVGSAWEGRDVVKQTQADQTLTTLSGETSSKILNLARKQRMNTDIRRSIFCVIMSSEDFVDAFEKLLRLGLKHKQEREIIYVILDCCQQEKTFNPFYAYLMQKFCEFDRRFQMTFQFTMWDKFKEMGNLSEQNRDNLAKLLMHLLSTKAVSLSIFKVVEFGTLDKFMVRFLKQVLQELLLDNTEEVIESVFTRIAPLTKLRSLQDGLKLFMQHFLLKKKSSDSKLHTHLKERVSLAEKALSSSQAKMLL